MNSLSWSCWLRGPKDHQTLLATACTWHPLELASGTLLLQILHTRIIEHGEIKLILTVKLHPDWLAFIVVEGAMYAYQGRKMINSLTLQPAIKTDLTRLPTSAIIAQMLWETFWLDSTSTLQDGSCAQVPSTGAKSHGWLVHGP